jgi:hypothetical protein
MSSIYVDKLNIFFKNIKVKIKILLLLLLIKEWINVDSFDYYYFKLVINI